MKGIIFIFLFIDYFLLFAMDPRTEGLLLLKCCSKEKTYNFILRYFSVGHMENFNKSSKQQYTIKM